MSKEEFQKEKSKGTFGIHWEAYDFLYGIRNSLIINPLNEGKNVLLNISRSKIVEAQERYGGKYNVVVLEIKGDPEMIRNRLKKRGRETDEQIDARIARDIEQSKKVSENAKKLITIKNDGTIEEGIDKFVNALKSKI
jgi:ribose 1,5-bisphosphokinase